MSLRAIILAAASIKVVGGKTSERGYQIPEEKDFGARHTGFEYRPATFCAPGKVT